LRDDFSLDIEALVWRSIVIDRPRSSGWPIRTIPTGNCVRRAGDRAILRVAQEAGAGFVVVDEAYRPFTDHSWMPRVAEFPNLLVMQTLSKLGLAGVRLGYVAGRPGCSLNSIKSVRRITSTC
jgi:histidinol-phosphate aminotransferase